MSSPTIKRRRLSKALRELRKAAGLEPKAVAERLEWDQAKVYRIERGDWVRPDPRDIRDLLDLYEVADDRQREGLLTLARESRQRGWWADYSDVFRGSLPDFEAGAAVIRTWDILIPGLLQTPDYTRAVFRGSADMDDAVIERRVAARMARQQILVEENPAQLLTVIDEAALHRLVGGPEVMAAQLEHIIKMSERPNIAIQVLPSSAGAHPAMVGGFVILDFESALDPSIVYIETPTDSLFLEQPAELHRYTVIYSHVQALALSPDESVRHVESIVRQLQR